MDIGNILLASNIVTSNSELKRLLKQNAVQIINPDGSTEDIRTTTSAINLTSGTVIKIGKRRYLKIV